MAPARHPDHKLKSFNNKISVKISGSMDTRLRPSGENSSLMDPKQTVTVDGNKSGAQDSVEAVKKEPWFEDKLPGNGKAENSFSVLYNSTSWENELDSSKNKSWFDLVEEDEANIENQSLNHEDIREQGMSQKSIEPLHVKIKEEVVDKLEDEEHDDLDHHHEATTSDLPIAIKQEKCIGIAKEKCAGISSKQDKCAIVEGQKKSSEKPKPLQKLEEKTIKQEKQLENIPLKRERNSSNIERVGVDSNCQRGKRIKQEIDFEGQTKVQSAKKKKHDCTDDKFIKQFTDEQDKEHIKVKDELNIRCSNNEDGSEISIRNRKRTLDISTESENVKRERNASSSSSGNTSLTQKREFERDPEILARRQKQIDYGKNTVGYDRYRQQIPKEIRTIRHPRTPPKHIKYSRRGWDGTVRIWRQQLHGWDPASEMGKLYDSVSDTSVEVSSVASDDNISDSLQSEHPPKLSTSTPCGSVEDIDNGDYLNLDHENLDHLLE